MSIRGLEREREKHIDWELGFREKSREGLGIEREGDNDWWLGV